MEFPPIEQVGLHLCGQTHSFFVPDFEVRPGPPDALAGYSRQERGGQGAPRWGFMVRQVSAVGIYRVGTDDALRRLGGPPSLVCGCDIYAARRIDPGDAATAAHPIGRTGSACDTGEWLASMHSAIAAARAELDAETSVWWHDCPDGHNHVVRAGPTRGYADAFATADGVALRA